MFRTMKSGGLQLRANLALAGHPNQFQSKPVAIKLDWDLLQDMDQGAADAHTEIVLISVEGRR